jgi:hypothetical protein
MIEILGKLLSAIMSIPWRDLGSALAKLFTEQKWVVILATTFLVVAVLSVSVYWRRGSKLESIVNDSLQEGVLKTV